MLMAHDTDTEDVGAVIGLEIWKPYYFVPQNFFISFFEVNTANRVPDVFPLTFCMVYQLYPSVSALELF